MRWTMRCQFIKIKKDKKQTAQYKAMRHRQGEITDAQWKGKKKNKCFNFLCKTNPVFPVLCAYNHLGFAIEVSGKLGRGQVPSGLGAVGQGSKVRGTGLSKGVPAALNNAAAEQEHNIRRRTSMQLGETHIPVCHDKQRGCVSMHFFYRYCKMCSLCLGSKTASTSSKQRGCPQKTFSATPSKVEPKVTEK